MADLLAIFGAADFDEELLTQIAAIDPDRVALLLEETEVGSVAEESPAGDAVRDRLAHLMAAIERRSRATVIGLAGDPAQLGGWAFDRQLSAPALVLA